MTRRATRRATRTNRLLTASLPSETLPLLENVQQQAMLAAYSQPLPNPRSDQPLPGTPSIVSHFHLNLKGKRTLDYIFGLENYETAQGYIKIT